MSWLTTTSVMPVRSATSRTSRRLRPTSALSEGSNADVGSSSSSKRGSILSAGAAHGLITPRAGRDGSSMHRLSGRSA